MLIYRRTATDNGETLGRAIPGANFHCVPQSGRSFGGRYWHLHIDWLVLSRLEVDQASVVTCDERVPDFSVWHLAAANCAANGEGLRGNELLEVRQGAGGSLRTAAKARVATFGLQSSMLATAPELDLPFASRPSGGTGGRWRMASDGQRHRFDTVVEAIWTQLERQPRLLDSPANRMALRDTVVEAILRMGETGSFRPDRAVVGRHSRIIARFERAIEQAIDEPLDLLGLCREAGTSRRSLEAIVREQTGRSPAAYLRWRRLWRARALLRQPSAETTVTDVAYRLGFWHLSRFAATYFSTFGERPSATLARAGGAACR